MASQVAQALIMGQKHVFIASSGVKWDIIQSRWLSISMMKSWAPGGGSVGGGDGVGGDGGVGINGEGFGSTAALSSNCWSIQGLQVAPSSILAEGTSFKCPQREIR